MISSLNTKIFDISGQMNSINISDTDILSNNNKLKLYIPKVMINIPKGEPTITKLITNGKSVFKNADKSPTLTGKIIYEKNYFETNVNATSTVNDINTVSKDVVSTIKDTLDEFASVNDLNSVDISKEVNYNIKKDTEIRTEFLNSKLDKLVYYITDKTKTDKKL